MRSRRGFLAGRLFDDAICGLTEEGDFLFICKVAGFELKDYFIDSIRCELSSGLLVYGELDRLQLWDPSMYVQDLLTT